VRALRRRPSVERRALAIVVAPHVDQIDVCVGAPLLALLDPHGLGQRLGMLAGEISRKRVYRGLGMGAG